MEITYEKTEFKPSTKIERERGRVSCRRLRTLISTLEVEMGQALSSGDDSKVDYLSGRIKELNKELAERTETKSVRITGEKKKVNHS